VPKDEVPAAVKPDADDKDWADYIIGGARTIPGREDGQQEVLEIDVCACDV